MKITYIIIYLFVLSCLYYFLDHYSSENIFYIRNSSENKISFWEAIYFTIITQSTIGFGDIVPKSAVTRFLVTFQSLGTILLVIYISKK